MKNITLRNLQDVTKGKLFNAKDVMDIEITAIISDSRKVRDESLFLCIKGERVDGHDFAAKVVEEGALAVLCERVIENYNGPYLLVDSVFEATQAIAEYYRRGLEIKVIGVTGSVGKTSTKEFIAAVLSKKFKVHKTKGNFNNQWGVPFTIFGIDKDDDVAVIEMGIGDVGEMDRLARIARPDVAVITNIGESHMEFFKSREGILKEKTDIFNYMNSDGSIILNGDDDKLATILSARGIKPLFYGFSKECTVSAENVLDNGLSGTEFDMVMRDGGGKMKIHVVLPVPGLQNVYNALAATLVGLELNIAPLLIKNALQSMKGAEGRNNIIKTERFTILDDCYNAAPKSMSAEIDILKNSTGRTVAIMGDMLELGEDSDKFHFQTGKYAGKAGIDLIICVGQSSEKTYMGAKMGSDKQVEYFKTNADCIRKLPYVLKDGDTILVKASNGMKFFEIVDAIKKL